MAVTVTSSPILAFNTITTITSNAATANTDALAEVFTITPTKSTGKILIEIGGTGSGADGDITYSFAAGDLWASQAITGTVTKNTTKMIEIETAKVMQDDGTILLTLTPASTDRLLGEHAAFVKVLELL